VRYSLALALETDSPLAAAALTAAERRDCAALATAERRAEWRAGRFAAKRAVALATGVRDLHAIELRARHRAAPEVRVPGLPAAPVSLSITHAAGRAAAVAVRGTAGIGIDLEFGERVPPGYARYFLKPSERAVAGWLGVTALWVIKEAAWKALRLSDAAPFAALEVHIGRDGKLRALSVSGERRPAWGGLSYPWPGALLAVVLT
jgi:phosphopantetheinyl transferase (holo-ACP synthase)